VPGFGEKFEGNFMKMARMLSLLAGVVLACHLSAASAEPVTDSAGSATGPAATGIETASPGTSMAGEGINRGLSQPPQNGALIKASLSSASDETSGTRTFTLTLPSGTDTGTLKIVLNGKDVTSRFSETSCSNGVCEEGMLSSSDGLRDSKNVLYAVAKKSDGTLASSRLRFPGKVMNTAHKPVVLSNPLLAQAAPQYPTASNFLPPTIAFNVSSGGWQPGQPWVTLGTQQSYPDSSYSCSGIYTVIVMDRQTLGQEEKPTSQCESDETALSTYLKTLPSNDLVIVGTNYGKNTAVSPLNFLDTTSIGGSLYPCLATNVPQYCTPDFPLGYVAIGAGGVAPGSAYENYYTSTTSFVSPFATGMLVEDANGNYNFQSSGGVEYTISPGTQIANNDVSTITLFNVGSLPPYSEFNFPQKVVFYSPQGQANGYWMLTFQRDTLQFDPKCGATPDSAQNQTDIYCGAFYPTGSTNQTTATQAYQNLAAALNAIPPDQLVFLVTVGDGAYSPHGSWFDIANTFFTDGNGNQQNAYYNEFAPALELLGGTPETTLSLSESDSNYTLVTCSNCGNSLNGHVVLSSNLFTQQQQTGFVHGILQRNSKGEFWPTKTSQESQSQNAAGGGANFTMDLVGSQQPVEWPELNGGISGGSSIGGEVAAYHYLSYQLVTQYYIKGAQGNYLDDIHYYFTGANNTYIDYHYFDPVNIQFPGSPGSCYTWTDPVTNTALTCFTQQDLSAIAQQVSTEIIDMDNILQFMVNGSTNMKDVVATGNGSAALALIGAASIVKGSTLQPAPTAPVGVNVSGILSLVSSVVNMAATIATDGLVPPDLGDTVSAVGSTISGIFDLASASDGGGLIGSNGGPAPLPSPDYTFETTIGDLANSSLQQQLTAGFDTELDSILGDWGKLNAIGPLITNSNNLAFYSPNQVAQNAAVTLLGQGSQRSFFMSLLPAYESIQYFPSWYGNNPGPNYPDMGSVNAQWTECNAWYSWSPQPPPFVSTWYPTYTGTPNPWLQIASSSTPVDFYIIGESAQNAGATNQHIPFIDSQLASTLFSSSGLNIPWDPFVTRYGPMKTAFLDATVNGFDNWPAKQTCSYAQLHGGSGVGATPPSASTSYGTTTTLSTPATTLLGESVTLQATVTSQAGVPTGTVAYQDGNTQLGTATLDANGNASFSATGLALGAHAITAYYLVNDPYYPSQSASSTVTVYANSPGMLLSLSAANLPASYGTTSSPVTLQVTSESGLAGTINFSCTGLPVGMTCNFNPAQASITVGGNVSTSFTVTSTATQTAGVPWLRGIGAILFSVSLISLWRIRRDSRNILLSFCLLLVSAVSLGGSLGCNGGGSSGPQSFQETGSKTVLVTATSGSITRTIPLVLNIQ
jgi:Bacterial Ig-like domain (group 3)